MPQYVDSLTLLLVVITSLSDDDDGVSWMDVHSSRPLPQTRVYENTEYYYKRAEGPPSKEWWRRYASSLLHVHGERCGR
jgi:hypothetical protein